MTREIAAKTVFVMLYIGAVEGAERWLRPDQVWRTRSEEPAIQSDHLTHALLIKPSERNMPSPHRW